MNVEIQGLAELDRLLAMLPARVQRNIARRAVRAGARVIRDRARALVPVRTGRLRRGIRVVLHREPAPSTVSASVGVYGDAYYGHVIEYGAEPHTITPRRARVLASPSQIFGRRVLHPGVRPRPFLRPALDEGAGAALGAVVRTVAEGIEREVAKLRLEVRR